ncbi:hypothetical protein COW81_03210 [Candidatus Campbellbacteria bacterium CG22_combo_CG10-13_8_21_14_all_36_13]|uniref:Type II secretion system protein GspG C-terminal domain-containing protein n=1 Tax=Candidatus Campbellbacteria bacterium CG22_combo_CG10-13_8_21_14_all_36_13 TaxID=1974529 RepID=A0A2H0DXJ2_9BACT|nr:MAG: hypothetical protein COW81_03210 [Candidatus Campbellbacteria bacterium CG22_combo_CG10-13_8_21_14_all_36_13]
MSVCGFTLIELLVVIAIIGLLSSVVLASLNTARIKARDAKRFAELTEMQKAIEFYYDANGKYPPISNTHNHASSWTTFTNYLKPYLPQIPIDPTNLYWYYDSDTGDNNQTYGMMIQIESSSNYSKVNNDGGYYNGNDPNYYEVGSQPTYCMNSGYSGSGRNWWGGGQSVCGGGN